MTSSGMTEIVIPPHEIRPATLVTARSYLIDRFVPDCEVVCLPAKVVAGGRVRFGRRQFVAKAPQPKSLTGRVRSRITRSVRRIDNRVFIDFRLRSPDNWAHFLDNHLPIYFQICEELGLDWGETLIVLPKKTPGYIRNVATLFGIEVLATDATIKGESVVFEVEPWTAIRPVRVDWVRNSKVRNAIARSVSGGTPLPARVFLARRDTRRIANEDEVTNFLGSYGFEKIYPETLSPADQFRIFREAVMIVAVHGAGLAPLIYMPPGAPLAQIIEILPCGHMTDFYRAIADKLDCPWIGVRGRVKAAYIASSYRFDTPFKRFSLDSFEVDVSSIKRAFEIARAPDGLNKERKTAEPIPSASSRP